VGHTMRMMPYVSAQLSCVAVLSCLLRYKSLHCTGLVCTSFAGCTPACWCLNTTVETYTVPPAQQRVLALFAPDLGPMWYSAAC
jgi:hypothetical protein